MYAPRLCNGSTADSGSACGGSNHPWGNLANCLCSKELATEQPFKRRSKYKTEWLGTKMYSKTFVYRAFWSVCYERLPIYRVKRSNRPFYFVSFKDANGKLLNPVSTKKETEKKPCSWPLSGCAMVFQKRM